MRPGESSVSSRFGLQGFDARPSPLIWFNFDSNGILLLGAIRGSGGSVLAKAIDTRRMGYVPLASNSLSAAIRCEIIDVSTSTPSSFNYSPVLMVSDRRRVEWARSSWRVTGGHIDFVQLINIQSSNSRQALNPSRPLSLMRFSRN